MISLAKTVGAPETQKECSDGGGEGLRPSPLYFSCKRDYSCKAGLRGFARKVTFARKPNPAFGICPKSAYLTPLLFQAYHSGIPPLYSTSICRITLISQQGDIIMLKRLTRKLFTLVMLCAALATVSSDPSAKTGGVFCLREINDAGACIEVCCTPMGCVEFSC